MEFIKVDMPTSRGYHAHIYRCNWLPETSRWTDR